MIRKLRMKLIVASMVSLLAVLVVIEGIAGILNYRRIVTEADRVLQILAENDGRFPDMEPRRKLDRTKEEKKDMLGQMSPELPYESRFFSVFLDSEGNVQTSDIEKVARIDVESAEDYASSIWKSGKE